MVLLLSFLSGLRAQELKVSVQTPESSGRVPLSVYNNPSYEKMREKMQRDFAPNVRFFDNYAFDDERLNEYITNYLKYTRREHTKNISANVVSFVLGAPAMLFLSTGLTLFVAYAAAYAVRERRGDGKGLLLASAITFGGAVIGAMTAAVVLPLHFSARKDRKKALHFSMEIARRIP